MASPAHLPLATHSLEALQAAAPLDLLVGVYAAQEGSGALDLVEAAATALGKRFGSERVAVLALPVGWRDDALRAMRSWADTAPPTRLCLEPSQLVDAGQALRALLAAAGWLEVRGAMVMDASLAGLPSGAIGALLEPVAAGQADCALPAYTRSVAEGTLTTNLLAPLGGIVYGRSAQQLVGGCAALSAARLRGMLQTAATVEGWTAPGTQIWLATRGLMPGGSVVQVHLGRRPSPPTAAVDLPSVVADTVGALFILMERDWEVWREPRHVEAVPLLGGPADTLPDPGRADVDRMVRAFRLGLKDLLPVWEQIMPDTTLVELYPLALPPPDEFRFAPHLWARVVLDFAVAHHERRLPRDHLLRALTPLYLGRVAAFLLETRRALPGERAVEEVAAAYEAERPSLVARWR